MMAESTQRDETRSYWRLYRFFAPPSTASWKSRERADIQEPTPGAVLLRENIQRNGIVEWVTERLTDPSQPNRITHSRAELLRTKLLLLEQH